MEASFDWTTLIKDSDPLKLIIPKANGGTTTLAMRGLVTTPLDNPGAATYEATASLDNFKVNLFGFIILWFDDLRFEARKGQKPDVAVRAPRRRRGQVRRAAGVRQQTARQFIPSNGFSDPPALTVTPSGIARQLLAEPPGPERRHLLAVQRLARAPASTCRSTPGRRR